MWESNRAVVIRRVEATTTTSADACAPSSSGKMSLCRACLVLLTPQDIAYDLHKETELASKFVACTGCYLDKQQAPHEEDSDEDYDYDDDYDDDDDDEDDTAKIILKCICESCFHLVDKFHKFQRMCIESLQNFQNLLQEVSTKAETMRAQHEKDNTEHMIMDECQYEKQQPQQHPPQMEEIEKVYILEEAKTPATQREEKVAPPTPVGTTKRLRGQRQTLNCSICQRGFYSSLLLEAHILRHRGKQPYSCVHCKKSYARANLLYEHISKEHEENRKTTQNFSCPYIDCDNVYTAQRSLNYHVKRHHHHGDNEKNKTEIALGPFVCDICGKSYARKAHFMRHQWVHKSKDERPYECSHCSQRFYDKQFLNDHVMRRHSNVNHLRCSKCGRLMGSRHALNVHMKKSHSNMSNIQCDTCKSSFSNLSNLRAHQRVAHSRVRPYSCDYCPARFTKRAHVNRHEMLHTGERPFKCVPCKRTFIQQGGYDRHMIVCPALTPQSTVRTVDLSD